MHNVIEFVVLICYNVANRCNGGEALMHDTRRKYVNLYELLNCLTSAADLISPQLANHHQQVAYMAFQIADHMELPIQQKQDTVLAGLMHDIGATSLAERLELAENEPPSVYDHAFKGADMIESVPYLKQAGNIIRYHHVPWNYGQGKTFLGEQVPLLSGILYLADRAVLMLDKAKETIGQVPGIRDSIMRQKGVRFMPEAVDAFVRLSHKEYIWMDITYDRLYNTMQNIVVFDTLDLELDEVIDLVKVFARVIDEHSPFTANHSAGVAQTARKLAELAGFSNNECKMMVIAGYLHDLGKLAVDNKILDKPDKLTHEEFTTIKCHTYYTYRLLQTIKGFEQINAWASFHHEKLDGTGYPFRLQGHSIPLGSRIMAVADVFTAITEDRPYRKGMNEPQTIRLIEYMADQGSLCPCIVSLLKDNFDTINKICRDAQQKDTIKKMERSGL